jgi:pimeloyl-ACP methyl ester carboxylesterase
MRAPSRSALVSLLLTLAACTGSRQALWADLTEGGGWRRDIVPAGQFDLAAAFPPTLAGEVLTVYLEGDGLAYVRPRQPALDPTPDDPIALRLALADPKSSAWLGRPCQYTLPDHGRGCGEAYWTGSRYAPEVVDGMNSALDALKARTGAHRLILAGYSGGGALAVLIAARRTDVTAVVTVAANLDLAYWTSRDGLAPLRGSLDPADVAAALGTVPQLHFTGGRDVTTGTDVIRSYLHRLPAGAPARLIEIADFDHSCCWAKNWPNLVGELGPYR